MYPPKFDNMDIQTEVSSQFGSNTVNFTIQSDISSNIANICPSEHGKVVWLQNFQEHCCYFLFQSNFPLQQRQLDQL